MTMTALPPFSSWPDHTVPHANVVLRPRTSRNHWAWRSSRRRSSSRDQSAQDRPLPDVSQRPTLASVSAWKDKRTDNCGAPSGRSVRSQEHHGSFCNAILASLASADSRNWDLVRSGPTSTAPLQNLNDPFDASMAGSDQRPRVRPQRSARRQPTSTHGWQSECSPELLAPSRPATSSPVAQERRPQRPLWIGVGRPGIPSRQLRSNRTARRCRSGPAAHPRFSAGTRRTASRSSRSSGVRRG